MGMVMISDLEEKINYDIEILRKKYHADITDAMKNVKYLKAELRSQEGNRINAIVNKLKPICGSYKYD